MATAIQLLRSKVAKLRPNPGTLSEGMPMVNIAADEPGLFFRATDGSLVKIGPAFVSSFAPNTAPAGFGGNTIGELWLDVSDIDSPVLKIWSGAQWVSINSFIATGNDSEIYFNNSGELSSDPAFTFDPGTETLLVEKLEANSILINTLDDLP